mmetsp:Transcript_11705/g.31517  ORF Transcript_11705/g.31517 Transcript_11705/m.31517 type:complete len:656 (-) Transcript_11705:1688-3655(-)
MGRISLLCVVALLACTSVSAFYLPGVKPRAFQYGDDVDVKAEAFESVLTQLKFSPYTLPVCSPAEIKYDAENLGQALSGNIIANSKYKFYAGFDETCDVLCRKTYTTSDVALFSSFIEGEYTANFQIDNLPVATVWYVVEETPNGPVTTDEKIYKKGVNVGEVEVTGEGDKQTKKYKIFNHLSFRVRYHYDNSSLLAGEGMYIVGFEVEPKSIQHSYATPWKEGCEPEDCALDTCKSAEAFTSAPAQYMEIPEGKEGVSIVFSYDVTWEESSVKWASRWDMYLNIRDDDIHWFSIINSIVIVFFLTGIVALILVRILRRDIAQYQQLETSEEVREESGWKLLAGDVFRAPKKPLLLSVLIGSGIQLLLMGLTVLVFGALGFTSPANRGVLMSMMIGVFVILGLPAGYMNARFAKTFGGDMNFKTASMMTALFFPGITFVVMFCINFVLWIDGSSSAIPFGSLVAILALWFLVSFPLVFVGGFLGLKKDPMEFPSRVNSVPRQVPTQVWYMRPVPSVMLGGLMPFGAVFVEMFFVITSIWQHKFYYLFGFIFLVFLILSVTSSEISIVMTYFHLCAEDYRWWWKSFMIPGATGIYIFLYATYYFIAHVPIQGFAAFIMYFGYVGVASLAVTILVGTVGFISTFLFVRKIYGSIKAD